MLAGCQLTTIEISDKSIATNYSIADNYLIVGDRPVVLTSKGFGIFRENSSFSIGWKEETRILIAPGVCKTVIISNNVEEVKRLSDALSVNGNGFDNLCVLKGKK